MKLGDEELKKTSFYVTQTVRDLIKKISFYEDKTKTQVINETLTKVLSEKIKKYVKE